LHRLLRQVRFSVNPFLDETAEGANSYCSRPCGEGLAVYLCLSIELKAEVNADTGFVVNVTEIDRSVRQYAVPIFEKEIRKNYRKAKHIGFDVLFGLISEVWGVLKDKFGDAKVASLSLDLNPNRKICARSKDLKVITISEKFEFAATHKLWNESFSNEKNFRVFGKCANPNGHGHNYIVEVTLAITDLERFEMSEVQKVVNEEFISIVDHKNLNVDVSEFSRKNPTVENITTYGWDCLVGKFTHSEITAITIWESDKMYCTYSR
jgi:6-pyruvoyltetrahydropterin/6-carboxytetrahydropterin synthase